MRGCTRTWRRAAVVAMAAGACAALVSCSSVVDGLGTPAGSGSGPGPATGAGAAGSPGAGSGSGLISASAMAGLLMTRPAGTDARDDAWGRTTAPTITQFVDEVYSRSASRTYEIGRLTGLGLTDIRHIAWFGGQTSNADDVLLRFATVDGATSRFVGASTAQANTTGEKPLALPGHSDVKAFLNSTPDSFGNLFAIFYARRRNVVLEFFYYVAPSYDATQAQSWVDTQLDRLPS